MHACISYCMMHVALHIICTASASAYMHVTCICVLHAHALCHALHYLDLAVLVQHSSFCDEYIYIYLSILLTKTTAERLD